MADNGLRDRRNTAGTSTCALRAQLNEAQLQTLSELERFGWEIRFVRRPLFQDAIPVVVDGDRKSFAVLTPEGELDKSPGFNFRQR
ncbi:hypothetical protein [Aerolutibacter daejeonensis]|uniref:hypothetical protein n=1 Tax=Aerolutibacter daejeonensis TaxID=346181 RepID=UPI0006917B21|nr:hypothetical protein [Lysobacter daejeonensis]